MTWLSVGSLHLALAVLVTWNQWKPLDNPRTDQTRPSSPANPIQSSRPSQTLRWNKMFVADSELPGSSPPTSSELENRPHVFFAHLLRSPIFDSPDGLLGGASSNVSSRLNGTTAAHEAPDLLVNGTMHDEYVQQVGRGRHPTSLDEGQESDLVRGNLRTIYSRNQSSGLAAGRLPLGCATR